VEARDALAFAGAPLLLSLAAAAACLVPARRAARILPMETLGGD
jgi:ABC-type lipoprotein release transport system permease subunit